MENNHFISKMFFSTANGYLNFNNWFIKKASDRFVRGIIKLYFHIT